MKALSATLLLLSATALPAQAQHQHRDSPYAGTQSEELPTLTAEEVRQLREGEGMGLARPAELNGFPGPRHVLDLAEDLALSAEQKSAVDALRAHMQDEAIRKGEEILETEAHLARAFSEGKADPATVRRMTAHLGALRGELRSIHLLAHVSTRSLMTPDQVLRYQVLRGYTEGQD